MSRSKPVGRIKRTMTMVDEVAVKATAIGVPPEQIARGHFEIADVRLDDGERASTHRTLVNRGGTAIERWLNERPSTLFNEPERAAVRYCQRLWQRIDKKGPPDMAGVRTDIWSGQSEHDALATLATFKKRFPVKWWDCFENICRFELDAPYSGRELATNNRTASDGAKLATAFVAGMIAQWEGY